MLEPSSRSLLSPPLPSVRPRLSHQDDIGIGLTHNNHNQINTYCIYIYVLLYILTLWFGIGRTTLSHQWSIDSSLHFSIGTRHLRTSLRILLSTTYTLHRTIFGCHGKARTARTAGCLEARGDDGGCRRRSARGAGYFVVSSSSSRHYNICLTLLSSFHNYCLLPPFGRQTAVNNRGRYMISNNRYSRIDKSE